VRSSQGFSENGTRLQASYRLHNFNSQKEGKQSMSGKLIEILLVEDNPYDVELALQAFKRNRLANRLQVMHDGAEVLDYFFGEQHNEDNPFPEVPKLILLDLKLPKVNGLEVVKRLKADPRTRSIPIVMMTSSREQQDIIASYNLGVNSYIVKPVDFDQFTKVVEQLGFYWLILNQSS
jgi:two-component system response regulator